MDSRPTIWVFQCSSRPHYTAVASLWSDNRKFSNCSTPWPERAETWKTGIPGRTAQIFFRSVSRSNPRASVRSTLVITATSAVLKMVGYFSGLSSPSVVETSTRRKCSPRSKLAGQTRLPTFSIKRKSPYIGDEQEIRCDESQMRWMELMLSLALWFVAGPRRKSRHDSLPQRISFFIIADYALCRRRFPCFSSLYFGTGSFTFDRAATDELHKLLKIINSASDEGLCVELSGTPSRTPVRGCARGADGPNRRMRLHKTHAKISSPAP